MLELLLIIILLPIALAAGAVLLFGAYLFWKYIVAICLWIVAGLALLYGKATGSDMFWWGLGLFMVGCVFWPAASSDDDETPVHHKKH